MGRFLQSKFGRRDLNAENHWKSLEFACHKITRPTVIFLGGNGTTDTNRTEHPENEKGTRKINSICSLGERLIGLQENEIDEYSSYHSVDFLGFCYGKEKEEDNIGSFSNEEVDQIVDKMFLPLCVDEKGEKKYVKKCCENISLVTFFTHCWGAKEVSNIMRTYEKRLLKVGYSKEEINFMFSHFRQITYAPYGDETWVPTFRVDSLTDSTHVGYAEKFQTSYWHKLNGIEVKYDKAGFLHKKPCFYVHQDVVTLWTSRLVNNEANTDLSKLFDEHTIEVLDRDKAWNSVQDANNADVTSKILGYVFARSILRSLNVYRGKGILNEGIHDIVKEAETLLEDYDEKELQV